MTSAAASASAAPDHTRVATTSSETSSCFSFPGTDSIEKHPEAPSAATEEMLISRVSAVQVRPLLLARPNDFSLVRPPAIFQGLVGQWHFGKRRPSGADHEEQPAGLAGLDATLASRCRGASYPRSRPDFSRRRRPVLKPLFSRVVRSVAWNAVRGYGYRCRAARLSVPERLPGRRGPGRALPSRSAGHGRERRAVVRAVRRDVPGSSGSAPDR